MVGYGEKVRLANPGFSNRSIGLALSEPAVATTFRAPPSQHQSQNTLGPRTPRMPPRSSPHRGFVAPLPTAGVPHHDFTPLCFTHGSRFVFAVVKVASTTAPSHSSARWPVFAQDSALRQRAP